jgi:cytochrome c biogenesis protein CcmG/thiol:disulfide interchange protein DsbE
MRANTRVILFFAVAALLAFWFSRRPSGLRAGGEAKQFELPLVDSSGTFSLKQERGKPVLIEAFASWCSVCRSSAPELSDAYGAARAQGVRFVGVSVDDSVDAARNAKRAWNIPYDVALDDGQFSAQYRITLLPTFIVIDSTGRVRHVSSGRPSASELEDWLSEVGAARQ